MCIRISDVITKSKNFSQLNRALVSGKTDSPDRNIRERSGLSMSDSLRLVSFCLERMEYTSADLVYKPTVDWSSVAPPLSRTETCPLLPHLFACIHSIPNAAYQREKEIRSFNLNSYQELHNTQITLPMFWGKQNAKLFEFRNESNP